MATESSRPRNGRVEDAELLTGRGNYLADLRLPRMATACFVRSPHAFAAIKSIRIDAARAAPVFLKKISFLAMFVAIGVRNQ